MPLAEAGISALQLWVPTGASLIVSLVALTGSIWTAHKTATAVIEAEERRAQHERDHSETVWHRENVTRAYSDLVTAVARLERATINLVMSRTPRPWSPEQRMRALSRDSPEQIRFIECTAQIEVALDAVTALGGLDVAVAGNRFLNSRWRAASASLAWWSERRSPELDAGAELEAARSDYGERTKTHSIDEVNLLSLIMKRLVPESMLMKRTPFTNADEPAER